MIKQASRKTMHVIMLSMFSLLLSNHANAQNWQKDMYDKDNDVLIETAKVKGSDVHSFRGTTHVKSTLSGAVAMLLDYRACPEWVYSCRAMDVISAESDTDLITYMISDMPWPVKNRDVVTHSVVTQDPATKVVSIKIDKAEDIFPKDRDFVRMKKLDAIWQLTPIENDVLRVTYEAHADPGGGLPSWLINSLIVDTPLNTLRNLRKVMIREKYQNTQLDFITN